jgi:hypothetical protein
MSERLLDHLVLPTADLTTARKRLEGLGFTVAPDGVHPFGTANCCVYFEDGTFLEPLAIMDQAVARVAAQQDNVFVARDAQYRQLRGDEGFSALVLKSDNATADDAHFRAEGIAAGPILDFERLVIDAQRNADIAAFRLAFAAEPTSPGSFFFTCERVRSPAVDRAPLQQHANGVRGIRGVTATAVEPFYHAEFVDSLLDAGPADAGSTALTWQLGDVQLTVENGDHGGGLTFSGVSFGVDNLDRLAALLKSASIAYEAVDQSIVVPPAPGQGAVFIFEATV